MWQLPQNRARSGQLHPSGGRWNSSTVVNVQQVNTRRPRRLSALLKVAVKQRGNRPPLAAYANWIDIVRRADDQEIRLPTRFPWTPSFSRSLQGSYPERSYPWDTFRYGDRVPTLTDPMTADLVKLKTSYGPILADSVPSSRRALPWRPTPASW